MPVISYVFPILVGGAVALLLAFFSHLRTRQENTNYARLLFAGVQRSLDSDNPIDQATAYNKFAFLLDFMQHHLIACDELPASADLLDGIRTEALALKTLITSSMRPLITIPSRHADVLQMVAQLPCNGHDDSAMCAIASSEAEVADCEAAFAKASDSPEHPLAAPLTEAEAMEAVDRALVMADEHISGPFDLAKLTSVVPPPVPPETRPEDTLTRLRDLSPRRTTRRNGVASASVGAAR